MAVILLMLAGIGLRVLAAIQHPLEQDELYTVLESRDLFATTLLPGIDARPLYYILNHPLLALAGGDVRWMRMVPLVAGVAGLWLTWAVARRLGGRVAGLAALLLTALSPWHLYASEFARYWSLVYVVSLAFLYSVTDAYATDERPRYLQALLCGVVGAFTHPAFVFGLPGAILALHCLRPDGTLGWRPPTAHAMRFLWGPLVSVGMAWALVLALTGDAGAAQNFGGRGLRGTLMLVPAIAQWAQPAVLAAGSAGALVLLMQPSTRHFAAIGVGSAIGLVGLLFAAAWRTDVYADYAIGFLPFVHVAAGALLAALPRVTGRDRLVGVGVALVLLAGVLPSTVSHMLDGTRFDHRPALNAVRALDASTPVMGWPEILMKQYGRDLRHLPYAHTPAALTEALQRNGAFWLVLSVREYGYPWTDEARLQWVADQCRRRGAWHRLRLDSRQYRVELYRCETGATPRLAHDGDGAD